MSKKLSIFIIKIPWLLFYYQSGFWKTKQLFGIWLSNLIRYYDITHWIVWSFKIIKNNKFRSPNLTIPLPWKNKFQAYTQLYSTKQWK
jgi:hypothetical protein